MRIEGAGAVVTGGAGGLGEATVRRLHAAGAHVAIADLAADKGKALADELGDRARFVECDATSEDSVASAVAAAAEAAPLRIAAICHGAGEAGGRTVRADGKPHDLGVYRRTIEVYLVGTFNVLRLAAAQMMTNDPNESGERGVVVNTASIAGIEGQVGQVAYSSAKGGVIGMTLVAARDLAPAGVRVCTIAPGVFLTPAYGSNVEAIEAEWGRLVPFPNRMGRPDEYAALVQHIAENSYLNGEIIRLDGALRFQPKNPPR